MRLLQCSAAAISECRKISGLLDVPMVVVGAVAPFRKTASSRWRSLGDMVGSAFIAALHTSIVVRNMTCAFRIVRIRWISPGAPACMSI